MKVKCFSCYREFHQAQMHGASLLCLECYAFVPEKARAHGRKRKKKLEPNKPVLAPLEAAEV